MMSNKFNSIGNDCTYTFGDNCTISEQELSPVVEKAIKTIYDELPNKARRIDVIKLVLKLCKKELYSRVIILQ